MSSRGFADLSPPEAQHAMLELPTNRLEYVGMLQEMGDYPSRSPIGHRIPSDDEVAALKRAGGRWRAVMLLEDERALRLSAVTFQLAFVLDPFFDNGAMLYAAWHDPIIRDEHSRRLAEHAGLLVRVAALLNASTAVLAPDHLPGSWNPRPGWRRPRANADPRQLAAWAMRSALVLLYWADRLDALVCTSRPDVVAALDVIAGSRVSTRQLAVSEPALLADAQAAREGSLSALSQAWTEARRVSRRRMRTRIDDIADALSACSIDDVPTREWRLLLGPPSVPEPALLIRRVLNGEDPERPPPLPTRKLHRPLLCLLA